MDDKTISTLIGNEKEWRRYLVVQIKDMREEHLLLRDELKGLKVWNIVWRFLGSTAIGVVMTWIIRKG